LTVLVDNYISFGLWLKESLVAVILLPVKSQTTMILRKSPFKDQKERMNNAETI